MSDIKQLTNGILGNGNSITSMWYTHTHTHTMHKLCPQLFSYKTIYQKLWQSVYADKAKWQQILLLSLLQKFKIIFRRVVRVAATSSYLRRFSVWHRFLLQVVCSIHSATSLLHATTVATIVKYCWIGCIIQLALLRLVHVISQLSWATISVLVWLKQFSPL